MIKSNELRIGNWVKMSLDTVYKIAMIDESYVEINKTRCSIGAIQGIPLTKEIFLRLFKCLNYQFENINLRHCEKALVMIYISGTTFRSITTVHEFQNWYYMLFGKEFEITKEILIQPVSSTYFNDQNSHLGTKNVGTNHSDEDMENITGEEGYFFLKNYFNSIEGRKYYNDTLEKRRIQLAIEKAGRLDSNYIPYQLCPKCDGRGNVPNHYPTSLLYLDCDVCNGEKIIPMYSISKEIF